MKTLLTTRLKSSLGSCVLAAGAALLAAGFLVASSAPGAHAADAASGADEARIVGKWLNEPKDGIIEFTRTAGGLYEGRIVGGNEPTKLDTKNPDPALRSRLLKGTVITQGLRYQGEGKYGDGTIYDPEGGSTYKLKVEALADGTLKVRGFIGFALLGKTQIWTRYTSDVLDLPPARTK
jgi:uncharacterized protein (DUF2147 family)